MHCLENFSRRFSAGLHVCREAEGTPTAHLPVWERGPGRATCFVRSDELISSDTQSYTNRGEPCSRGASASRGTMPTNLPRRGGDGGARGLRTGVPNAKPSVPFLTLRKFEALGSVPRWPAVERLGWCQCRCQEGADSDRHGRNGQLVHDGGPSLMVVYATTMVA